MIFVLDMNLMTLTSRISLGVNLQFLIKETTPTENTFSTFSIQKPDGTNLTLPLNRLRSTHGHHLYKLKITNSPDITYQVSRQLAQSFWRRRFKLFIIYGHGGHLGHMTWTKYINFLSPIAWRLHMKFK